MRPHGKYAAVDATNPEAFAQCDRCGFWYNRSDLVFQTQWSGTHIYNIGVLLCKVRCFDTPQEQLRTIILPPDPPPVLNARPPNLAYENTGPVQSILSANVAQGATVLPVVDATGFEKGDLVWVQLNNADLAQMLVVGVDVLNNLLNIGAPLPFSAPIYGVVSVDGSESVQSQNISAAFSGAGDLVVSLSGSLLAFAGLPGIGGFAAGAIDTSTNEFDGVSALSISTTLTAAGIGEFDGVSSLAVDMQVVSGTPSLDFSDPNNSQYIGMFP